MNEADMRRILEHNFMPKDTETQRWLGLKSYSLSNEVFERPSDCGHLEFFRGNGVDLTLEFAVDEYFPPSLNRKFSAERAGGWFLCEQTVHRRIDRRDLAKLFGEE